MKPDNNKILITILLLMLAMQCSCLLGQSVIQLHRKDERQKDYLVQTGRRARIVTYDKLSVNGKIDEIKDSSIIIGKKSTEVPINKIHYFFCQKINAGNIVGAVCSAAALVGAAILTESMSSIPALSIAMAATSLPFPIVGLCYFLTNKERFNTQSKYDLKIVKAQ